MYFTLDLLFLSIDCVFDGVITMASSFLFYFLL